ncbi:MAG: efflux RND transporter periplasmic adaptor subunit [Methyloprofundus sp.]|nr:efflux RND transporter periplasmic adaptor subunit [Methyloprofundus sp.]MDT8425484.1 efflux RND transporter periplasmic adaptor subunit [Methyloprofundus sp.]
MYTKQNIISALFSLSFYLTTSFSYANENSLVTVQPSFQTIIISGFTRARRSMPIASEISGKVTHIYADIGQPIPEDGIFACLDDTFIKLDIASTENSIAQHGIDLKFLGKQVDRHQKLVKTNSAALSLLDDLTRQKGNAYRAIQNEKIRKEKQLETKKRHCIKAPKNWKITQRSIEPGQWISAGVTIAQASDYSQLLIPITLTAEELTALQNQNKLSVYLPEYQQEIPVNIERISPEFDSQSHKILVDLLIKDTSKHQRGGIRTELTLNVSDKLNNFLIPKDALDARFEEVWLTRKNGERIRVMLQGYADKNMAKVSSLEIKTGDQFKRLNP